MRPISYICSQWHPWFIKMGYPQLDVNLYTDGSWDVIEYYNVPILPSLTRYKTVLGNMKNLEISFGFIEKYLKECDAEQQFIWKREEERTRKMILEHEAKERHAKSSVDTAFTAMRNNPDLMNRIAKNGLQEMNIDRIYRNIPQSQRKGLR